MSEIEKLSLTKKEFKEYLERFNPNDTVGYAGRVTSCPIARYYKDKHRKIYIEPADEVTYAEANLDNKIYRLKKWQNDFAGKIDAEVLRANPVTKEKALEILKKVS